MIATVPMEGSVHLFTDGSLPIFRVDGAVKVRLALDNEYIGSVSFAINAPVTNARATEMTFLLTGSYVRVQGEAMFDVPNETLLREVVDAL